MEMTIDELLMTLVKKGVVTQIKACEVVSVDKDKDSCILHPYDESPELLDVRLTASIEDKNSKIVVYPKVGSTVLSGVINNMKTQCYVCGTSEIDEALLKVGDMSFKIDSNKIEMNGGSLGGLIKIDAHLTDINKIKADIRALKTAISSWVVVPADGGAALKAAVSTWVGQPLPNTVKSDIENTKVTQ